LVTPNVEIVPDGGFIDYANTMQAPGYAVFGLNASYTIQDGVEFFVDARNLTNKRHVTNYSTITNTGSASTAVFYPGEGRRVFAGVKVMF
jgi:iron complex outermembrane recepter protein